MAHLPVRGCIFPPMSLSSAAGLLALAAAVGGCAGLGGVLKEPDVRLDQVVVRDVGVRGGKLDLMIDVENPNRFDLRGTEIQLGFDVEGSHVGDLVFADEFTVDRGGRTRLALPLRFEWAGVGAALRTALSQGAIPYEMKGQLKLVTPWGAQSVPFTRTGRAPLTSVGDAVVPSSR
jgi:LEA14-like dessication related protein